MEALGLSHQILKMGKYKESGTAHREWTKDEKAELEKIMSDTYNMFVNDVATARDLNISKQEVFADAHIFTARQALEVGLIDEVGTLLDAEIILEKLTVSFNPIPVWEKESQMEKFMKEFSSELFSHISLYLEPRLK